MEIETRGKLKTPHGDRNGITGTFSGCHDQTKTNVATIAELSDYAEVIGDFVTQLHTATEEKFFMVSKEVAALSAMQAEMLETQQELENNRKTVRGIPQ